MTTLIERSRQARTGLERTRLANQFKQQISAIQARTAEWTARRTKRKAVQAQWQVLQSRLQSRPDVEAANAAARALCEQARATLESGADIQALSADNLWTRLLNSADSACAVAAGAVKMAWGEHVAELGGVEAPAVLESHVLRTPAAREALERYKTLHFEYLRLVRQDPPSDAAVLAQLAALFRQIKDVRASLTIDAPEPVRNFFMAVENGGAAIDQLTPDVLDWLRTHDDIQRFVIKFKAVVAWG